MGYRFTKKESVRGGVRRMAHELLDTATRDLGGESQRDLATAIHETRRTFKKIRAILRLVQPELGKEVYSSDNAFIRDASRQLSGLRDAKVLVATMDRLIEAYPNEVDGQAVGAVRGVLQRRLQTSLEGMEDQDLLPTMTQLIDEAGRRVARWSLRHGGWRALQPGLGRVYRLGSRAHASVLNKPTDASFHEWRKQAKYLYYHVRVLGRIRPKKMKPLAAQLDELTEALGDANDLSVLQILLIEQGEEWLDQTQLDELLNLIKTRRCDLLDIARELGSRIFREKPNRFVKRLDTDWKAWRRR